MNRFLEFLNYQCPLKYYTGLKCAFCGMTHSWIALLSGDLTLAFRYNFLGPILFAFVGVVVFASKWRHRHKRAIAIVSVSVLVVFTVVRNIFGF